MGSRRAFVVLYTLSGAAGLVYEVTWTRLLALQMGHTVAAASTVLAAFMGGLAVGARAAGAQSRFMSPGTSTAGRLRVYAALEVAVAAAALLLPLALGALVPILGRAYADGGAPVQFAAARVAISLLLVGIPAAAMGATFPVAVGVMSRSSSDAGLLYAANTAGAAAGAIAAGFWLIPWLGLRGTTWVGVALNMLAASGAVFLAAQLATENTKNTETQTSHIGTEKAAKKARGGGSSSVSGRPAIRSAAPGLAAAAAAVSGFAALVYEVAWTRLLAMVIGPTTYAFATMAAAFITGIAIGSALGAGIGRRGRTWLSLESWLAASLMAGGLAATFAAWYAATRMPLSVAVQVVDPTIDFSGIVRQQALAVGLLLLPMTLTLGVSFSLALALAGGGAASIAQGAARVYAANTAGAIAGALSAGFLLIPALGLRDTIRAAALVTAFAGAFVLAAAIRAARTRTRSRTILELVVPLAASLVAILATPPWDRTLLASGAYKYAPYLAGTDLDAVLRAGTLDYYKEGPSGTVSVRDLAGTRSLAIDGKVDASNAGDMLTQRLLGLLPGLIHGHAEDIAVIGLGSGVTAGSVRAPGTVRHTDVVEISPEVVEASRFFDAENGDALSQPGVRLIVGDGRSHLLLTTRRYDVIISEPSNPWMAGVASLFTREFFEAAKSRLKPDGLICQWAHTYDIHGDDLKSIVRTFATVFPQGSMWLVGGGDLLLIGAKSGEILPRLAAVADAAARPPVDALLADVGVARHTAPFVLLSLFAGGPGDLERFGGTARIQTDDRTALEYSAPRGIFGRTKEDNAVTIRALAQDKPPAVRRAFEQADDAAWTSRGTMDLRAQAFTTAYEAFHQAVALNSRNAAALSGLSDSAGGANRLNEERDWLTAIAAHEPRNAAVRIELSRILSVLGDVPGGVREASEALQLTPDDPRSAEQLASVLADAADARRLTPLAGQIVSRFPERADSWYYEATALYLSGRTDDAIVAARRVVDAHPEHARAQSLLGAACAAAGRRDCAQAAFDASIRSNPRDAAGYINAGVFNLQIANPSSAKAYFANALAIDPGSPSARDGVAQARALLGKR
jgi:spermidine synthase